MINMSQSLLCCSAGFPSGCDILRIKGCLLFPKINSLFHFGLKVCQLLGVCVMFSFFVFLGVKQTWFLCAHAVLQKGFLCHRQALAKKTACLLWIPPGLSVSQLKVVVTQFVL